MRNNVKDILTFHEGHTMDEIRINNKPVDDFIVSPFDAMELLECVDSILNRFRDSDGNFKKNLIYVFSDEEIDTLSSVSDWLIERPIFKSKGGRNE